MSRGFTANVVIRKSEHETLLKVLEAAMFSGDFEFPQEFWTQVSYAEMFELRNRLRKYVGVDKV